LLSPRFLLHNLRTLHSSSPRENLSPTLWTILFLLFLSLFISYIDRGALSIAASTLEHEFSIPPSRLGILLSAFFWTYTPFLIFSGWLADRFSAGRILAIGFAVWSASTFFTGFSRGFAALLLCRLFLGVGESAAYPCFAAIVVRHFPLRHRGFVNSFINTGVCAGPAFGLLLGGALMGSYGWRPYFLALGALGFLWIPFWLARMPRTPQIAAPAAENEAARAPGICDILLTRSAWGTFLGHFGGNYFLYFLLTWLPYYLVHERQFSLARMGKIGALAYLFMAIVGLASGYASDRLINSGRSVTLVRKSMIAGGQAVGGLALAACALVGTDYAIPFLLVAAAAYGFNISNTWVIPQILAGPRASGRWTGLQNFIGNLAGVSAPVITGFLVQRTGSFVYPFLLAGLMSFLGAASWLFLLGPLQQVSFRTANHSSLPN
jgi:ACS family D-galactonate transporter-like MFS transporter